MDSINLMEIFGKEILSRANIRNLYDLITDDTTHLNMTGIEFISRSVADELCNIINKYPRLELVGMTIDVDRMLSIVRKGKGYERNYISPAKVSMTYNCTTMDDLREALLGFGH